MIINADIKNVKLKEYRAFMDNNCGLCLYLVYQYEAKDGVHELHIPKIELGIFKHLLPDFDIDHSMFIEPRVFARFVSHSFMLYKTEFVVPDKFDGIQEIDACYADTLVKENVVEMTLDDIEKKLGHKIKIVNKEG